VNPSIPTNVIVYPRFPNTIYISWYCNGNGYDINYRIYRKYYIGTSQYFNLIATIDPYYYGTSYLDQNLMSGTNYEYQISAINSSGCSSGLTQAKDAYASWRNSNTYEKVLKVYINTTCWNWCCGLFDGKIELVCLPITYNIQEQKTDLPKKYLGQKTKSQQKDVWCNYGTELFPWDMSKYAYTYMLSFYEDEAGNDRGVTIKLSAKFKISEAVDVGAEISYTIDNKDEEMGYFFVQYHDEKDKQYELQPRKGTAKVIVGQ
jgi:hypothetical protein